MSAASGGTPSHNVFCSQMHWGGERTDKSSLKLFFSHCDSLVQHFKYIEHFNDDCSLSSSSSASKVVKLVKMWHILKPEKYASLQHQMSLKISSFSAENNSLILFCLIKSCNKFWYRGRPELGLKMEFQHSVLMELWSELPQ